MQALKTAVSLAVFVMALAGFRSFSAYMTNKCDAWKDSARSALRAAGKPQRD